MKDSKIKDFLTKIITPNFLESVERWSRYDGEDFSIGDADVRVINKGEFVITSEIPKIIFGKGTKLNLSKTETTTYKRYYDVTLIRDSATCSNHDKIVLISERLDENITKKPRELFIYSIDEDYNDYKADDGRYTTHPTFERLKKDFESKTYKPYNSMLQEFCGVYTLSPFNDSTDRIFNFTLINGNLNWLDSDKESKDLCNHINVSPRPKNKHNY